MNIVFAVAACLAAALICLDAHKSRGGGFRRHFPFNDSNGTRGNFSRPASDRYSWNRTLDANTTVREGASIRNGSEVVVLRSKDKALRDKNYNESASVYDFSNDTAILIYGIDRGFSPCFLADITELTFSAVKDALTSRNGSTVETANKVSLTASSAPLSRDEEDDLRESNPYVRFVCFRKPIFRVAPSANAEPSTNATEKVVFFDLFNEVTITYPKRPQFPGPFGRPRFGRPGNGTEERGPGGPRGGPGGPRGGPGGPRGGPRGGPGGPRGGPGGPRDGPGGPRTE